MLNLIFNILNWIPIFHISCDLRFGEYREKESIRFSLLAIALGSRKLYLISYSQKKFKLFKTLNLWHIVSTPTQDQIDNKTTTYLRDITNIPNQEISIQYEFLKESFNTNCNTRSSLETKVSSYSSSYLVLAAFYAYSFNEYWPLNGVIFYILSFLFITGFFPLISCGAMILSFFKVKDTVRATFRDLKPKGKSTIKNQAAAAYTNWFASKSENTALATCVKNIESYMASAVATVFILWAATFLIKADNTRKIIPQSIIQESNEKIPKVKNPPKTMEA